MSEERTQACRCGAPMREEYAEAGVGGVYRYGDFLDPWAMVCWICDICGRTCTQLFSSAVEAGRRTGEVWCLHDARGWLHDLGEAPLIQVRGRGTVAALDDRFPCDFEVGHRVDVAGRRFVVVGVEGAQSLVFPARAARGVGLILRPEEDPSTDR